MQAREILAYAAEWRKASALAPGAGASLTPLIMSEGEMEEIVDGSQLTTGQLLRAAIAGIVTLPEQTQESRRG